MSLRSAPARPAVAVTAGLAAALLLAGCGTGQRAQTYQEKASADGTNTAIGTIAVRNASMPAPRQGITYAAGTDVPIEFYLVNNGAQDDALVSASTPAATTTEIVSASGGSIPVPRLGQADPRAGLLLRGLTRELMVGEYVELTLSFQRNGVRTILVPVETSPEGLPRPTEAYEVPETDSEGNPLLGQDNSPDTGSNPNGTVSE